MNNAVQFFAGIIFGHLVGDYLLQPQWMALSKSRPGMRGWAVCWLHSLVYTAAIALLAWTLHAVFLLVVLVTHALIDRYSLGQKWLDLIGGRNFFKANAAEEDGYKMIHVAFACIVYTAVDNGIHLMIVWYSALALGVVK